MACNLTTLGDDGVEEMQPRCRSAGALHRRRDNTLAGLAEGRSDTAWAVGPGTRRGGQATVRLAKHALASRDIEAQDLAKPVGNMTNLHMYVTNVGIVKEPRLKLQDAVADA